MAVYTSTKKVKRPEKRFSLEKSNVQRNIFLLLAIAPPFGGYLLFTLYPNILSVYYSLLNWDGMTEPVFIGFQNFIAMFQDQFVWRALSHNLFLFIIVPASVVIISLVLAYLLSYKNYFESKFLKLLFFFPNILSTVVIAILWQFIYDGNYGLLNEVLAFIGIDAGNFYWLGDERTALWAVVPAWIWGSVGLYVIIFVNAMDAIPKSFYEAAIMDGASDWTLLFKITLPTIMPIVRVSLLFLTLFTIKGFDMMLILTNGGPAGATDVIGLYMFNLAFGEGTHSYGYASAIGMLLFVILITAKAIMDRYMKKRGIDY
ncbi:ABC transporter permease [Virgibacillus profundi]|uniref:ABC transporter permease n=1 Tax=Virgibacillus profundi TaxID=2024555 RepID=A0A2A2IIM0_9BACI|nr:sugar ABC transporter permease [Virgibacillus profundi]PAV31228.1 ABC transporter permease [Virgibacillus profundi]PXY55413.1 sugar ABC transporter permease [Virgibacillus profundi]